MNKNLFLMEFRRDLLGLIIWMIVITILISVTMAIYPVFLENQSKIIGMMNILPTGLLQFKGISNINDLMSAMGFYSVNNIIYMMVLGSIYSIVLSSGILLREEYNKTAEYLLTRPLTRSEIFFSKLAVLFLNVFLLNLVTTLAGLISLEVISKDPFSIRALLILSLYTFLLNLLFAAVGLWLSTLVRRAKPITTFSIGLVLILYFIFTLSKITAGAEKIGYLTPFKFIDTNILNPDYGFNIWHLAYFIGISGLLTIIAYRLYLRKDIYT
jgi:ABC-2 type transport system permease protein